MGQVIQIMQIIGTSEAVARTNMQQTLCKQILMQKNTISKWFKMNINP